MKKINFIQPISPKKQHVLKKWWHQSVVLLLIIFFSISWFEWQQLHTFFTIRDQYKAHKNTRLQFEALETRKQKLEEKHAQLKNKKTKLDRHKNNPKIPVTLIQSLSKACAKIGNLETFSLHKKEFSCGISTSAAKNSIVLQQILSKLNTIKKIKLVSVSPAGNKNGYLISFQGTI